MAGTEWYTDFVDLGYRPSSSDLLALFYFEPAAGMSKEEAVGRIASESSTGTWTTLFKLPPRMKKLMAKAYEIRGNCVKIAYPLDLWEEGNAPQLLSGIAGNIFGMKALNNLRLLDVSLPPAYTKHFKGPRHGMSGIRSMMRVPKRPLFGAVPKPKVGFTAAEHAQIGYETWMGGFDLVKDDENLTSQNFNRFSERVKLMTRLRDKAERETGERKDALINITAETNEMQKRAKLLHDNGWRFAMIDVVVAGTASVQTLREVLGDYGMAIHAHRAMHASFDRNPKHGMTMHFLAKLMRLIGVDQIHAGTAVGKLVGGVSEVQLNAAVLRERQVKPVANKLLAQDWGSIKPVFPVSSGGLHPGLVPEVMHILGNECVILVSGGIHGHPKGTRAGAIASMQACDAAMQRIPLPEYAKKHRELAQALEKWGAMRPR
ncbi:MAG: type III ribulose-bisphosphate carboxylase [Candidatus Burarchaeum sp.]|nr:type III ribulose-bisphosphate carboxylase [Candidatus Burarchaeum sp.]MDO8339645.1 type III ribulose-bisphosphate carboxylase [Candidatus Burarchaeum sp.]